MGTMDSSPSSFGEEEAYSWCLWVLDHGLPELPVGIAKGESVPVARWAGPEFGAVLRVEWAWSPDQSISGPDELVSIVQVFRRTVQGWEDTLADGGSGWLDPPLQRPPIVPRGVHMGNLHSSGAADWRCVARYGVVGRDVASAELSCGDDVITREVESTIGAVIVASDGLRPSIVRLKSTDGTVVMAYEYPSQHFS